MDDNDMQCVKLHCHVEGLQLITDHFFRPLKQHVGGHQFRLGLGPCRWSTWTDQPCTL